MTRANDWLSLKIQKRNATERTPHLFISIPKKIVGLATERNRLKRLIREAFRKENGWNPECVYGFRVMQKPGKLELHEVREAMVRLVRSV